MLLVKKHSVILLILMAVLLKVFCTVSTDEKEMMKKMVLIF